MTALSDSDLMAQVQEFPAMLVEGPSNTNVATRNNPAKSVFQQMVDERLALSGDGRRRGAVPEPAEDRTGHDETDQHRPPILDSRLLGLHLEEMVAGLDEARRQAERTLRRLQQVVTRIQKGQEGALGAAREGLGMLAGLAVEAPRVVTDLERQEILQSMIGHYGSVTPPEGSVYRLYREDLSTSFFVLSDGRVLALKDGTIGSAQDKDELVSLVMSELRAGGAAFGRGIDDLQDALERTKLRFANQLAALSTTLAMQSV